MVWSFSKSRIFSQCQRKWYYLDLVAYSCKDPKRKEAYLLKQLQSVYAWRGSLVDNVITNQIIPKLKYGNPIKEEQIIDHSMELMEKQLAFGRERKHLLPGMTKSAAGDDYCAFYDLEYNGGLNVDQLTEASEDVRKALLNLMRSDLIHKLKNENSYLVPQRALTCKYVDESIRAVPDLIVFHNDKPPTIIEWKVHSFGNTEYWLQLGIYGWVLSRVKPHKDFPSSNLLEDPTRFRYIEYQLLSDEQREYTLTEQDFVDIEDYIFQSIIQIKRLTKGKKFGEIDPKIFQTATSPKICMRCQFRKICWKGGLNGAT